MIFGIYREELQNARKLYHMKVASASQDINSAKQEYGPPQSKVAGTDPDPLHGIAIVTIDMACSRVCLAKGRQG